jgi:hypothetical protein
VETIQTNKTSILNCPKKERTGRNLTLMVRRSPNRVIGLNTLSLCPNRIKVLSEI